MRQLKIHSGHVRAVQYTPDGNQILSASNDRTVCLTGVQSGKVIRKWGDFGRVMSSATFFRSGTMIAAAGGRLAVELLDVEGDFSTTVAIPPPVWRSADWYPNSVSALGFSPDGSRFFAGTGDKQTSNALGEVHLWQCHTPLQWSHELRSIVPGSVWSGAFSPDGTTPAVGTGVGWQFCTVSPLKMGAVYTQGTGTKALACLRIAAQGRIGRCSPQLRQISYSSALTIPAVDVAEPHTKFARKRSRPRITRRSRTVGHAEFTSSLANSLAFALPESARITVSWISTPLASMRPLMVGRGHRAPDGGEERFGESSQGEYHRGR